MNTEEFKLFIQSIGFVYQKQMMSKEFYKLGEFELVLNNSDLHRSHWMSTYTISQKIQLGVTRTILKNVVSDVKDDLDIFKSIIREHKLNKLL
jgi:hypothetical protein